jgi:hypothetical protein
MRSVIAAGTAAGFQAIKVNPTREVVGLKGYRVSTGRLDSVHQDGNLSTIHVINAQLNFPPLREVILDDRSRIERIGIIL